MHCRRVACPCRICTCKASRIIRDARKPRQSPPAGALAAEPDRPAEVPRLPTDDRASGAHMRALGHHLAGFVVSLAHTAPALAATTPRAVVVAACTGTARSSGQLVVEIISCVKASWVRCIIAMPPLVRHACLLRLVRDSRRRECLVCLRSKTALCVRAAHAYWLDAGCVTLAIAIVVMRTALCPSCTQNSLMEHSLPSAWAFMNPKGWKRKNGFTHLPHVDWIVQRNGTLVDPRGRMRGWTPVYPPPPPSSPSDARALPNVGPFPPFPETDDLMFSIGSLSDALATCIASYAPAGERERLLFRSRPKPPLSPSSLPPVAAVAPPPPRTRPRKPPRPQVRSERPGPSARPERAVALYDTYGDAGPLSDPATGSEDCAPPPRVAVAQTPRSCLACGSGARCPAPSQMVHTDKRHVRAECDAGCLTRYHGACWRNRRGGRHADGGAPAEATHDEPCPTPDCWGTLVRVISVGGASLVEHVVWPRDKGADPAPRASVVVDRRDAVVRRHPLVDRLRDRPPVYHSTSGVAAATIAEPARVDTPPMPSLSEQVSSPPTAQTTPTTTTTPTTRHDRPASTAVPPESQRRKDRPIGGDDGKVEGPPSIYDACDRVARKKVPRVRAQKRQRVRAREKAAWCATVADGPPAVDPAAAAYDDDLLWPEFFRP
ncbi:hypothetical protein pdul_cds_623 [Pandoravirus dulcis]|uniref:Uncharacterized protein n=1 Tax=Pandoravirus dulcis TaxID=1349409 RepID=S4VQW0_9VIRU|nr:hypothetical protein pdul_cds_623 [Pandoravirus dulcis]AGO82753.1 hypothetical protein pdul_cds_623 [Pandoravirus dulcis]